MLIIFFDMKGNVNKEFIMAAPSKFRTLLWHFMVKMCKDFTPNFGDKTEATLNCNYPR
jgi:hypothetical protein